ncbi:lipid-A-disaccharide synthase [Klebsormidium nitens]|uniref:lipid-A-disaccharide synthase n=1 Tax=Klebsormidium nitens TaxID=105231 RepID=A0A0U9HKZ5_KLENI|nr:lipid-A-disaccharide synthase [Klebsormidium nitens]|eukprot:GAQ85990.1 lipid-A-disaccharide synthase [Klebsormidium nitens]
MHATGLVHEVRKQAQAAGHEVTVCALGGGGIEEAGVTLVGDNRGLSSIGLLEALPLVLPTLRLQAQVRAFLRDQPPDLVILIDYPGVNIPFGRYLKRQYGCPVVYYVPPNEWLWNEARTPALCAISDAILCTYPREAGYFQGAGGSVQMVGHPLLDAVASKPDRPAARAALGVSAGTLVVALLPASRPQEVRHVWPVLARAAQAVQEEWASSGDCPLRFFIPVVSSDLENAIRESLQSYSIEATIWKGDSHTVLAAADLALTKSGTVNLELALFQVPQVVVYRIDAVTAWLARTLFHFSVPHISLVNLILEEPLVPEFIQDAARPEDVAAAALGLLRNQRGARDTVLDGYRRLSALLGGPGAAGRAAATILTMMTERKIRTSITII